MRLLKVFVILMALVIAVGAGVLVWGFAHHWNRMAASGDAAAASPAADSSYAAAEIPAPNGMSFAQMATTSDRLLLRFSGPQGERIVVVDPRTGRVTGNIAVTPATP
jgi:hypothetical protein